MNRGELWTVSGGTYAQRPRPALIIQDDLFAASESITLLPLTSQLTDAPLLRLTVEPGQLTGLERVSQIMVDKLTTVRRANLGLRMGRVDAKTMVAVEQSLAVFLGLGR
ncbi:MULTISPECIES: type II toxin-antitoxin system PemK/MazF family toxin [Micrococcaceae]|uniref:type II toxin-antitoxin system PemK/MazF family toxin n=1 Tax=Micrococcaceae TaxID=1268 RepID=UPI000CE32561|nr:MULTISPECIES: type II toxin-antitoxin system PemK/MazF family toxin [Micrococcaceae]MCO4238648.1 type II toxin-antitoxin system PemK/MazF family toxin [Pseudarthrobacter sp. MDT3-28]